VAVIFDFQTSGGRGEIRRRPNICWHDGWSELPGDGRVELSI
jgi:hypothetical protein